MTVGTIAASFQNVSEVDLMSFSKRFVRYSPLEIKVKKMRVKKQTFIYMINQPELTLRSGGSGSQNLENYTEDL